MFQKFCQAQQTEFKLPISPKMGNSFIVWAAEGGNLGSGTVKAYLAALHSLGRIFDGERAGRETEKLLLAGAANVERQRGKERRKRAPGTFKVLKRVIKNLETRRWKKTSKAAVKAFCCACYFGSFRAGELLPKKEWDFDKFSDLLWRDVAASGNACGNYKGYTVHVKMPKTRVEGGEQVDLYRFDLPEYCPVRALDRLADLQKGAGIWDLNLPVFRLASGKNLTVSSVSKILRGLLVRSEFRSHLITASSFRAGVPTDMEGRPDLFGDDRIQSWGRWRSTAYRRYMKGARERKLAIFKNLSGMLCKNL